MLSRRHLAGLFLTILTASVATQERVGTNEDSLPNRDLVPVFGVIVDPDGKPVPGATVREVRRPLDGLRETTARRMGHGTRLGAATETNEHGKFVLKVPAGGTFGIVAMRGADERSQVVAPAAPAGQHRLVLRRLARVRGHITDVETIDGEPRQRPPRRRIVRSVGTVISNVPGRKPLADFGVIDEVTCDADGTFELAILEDQACYLTDRFWRERVLATRARKAPFELRLPVRRVASRVVHNLTGDAVPTALLHVDDKQLPVAQDGSFATYIPIGRPLRITAPGFYGFVHSGNYITSSVGLPEAATATLVLRRPDGSPAANVELFARPWPVRSRSNGPMIRYRTDQDGRTVLTRMMDNDYELMADFGGRLTRIATVEGGIDDQTIPVSTATYTVRGTVVDPDGLPCAHIPVYVGQPDQLDDRLLPAQQPAAFTDHAGKFVIPSLPGIETNLTAAWHAQLRAPIVPVSPKKAADVHLKLRVKR